MDHRAVEAGEKQAGAVAQRVDDYEGVFYGNATPLEQVVPAAPSQADAWPLPNS